GRARWRYRFRGTAARGDLRLGDGEFLLREIRCGPLPHAHARGDRSALSGVQDLYRFLTTVTAVPLLLLSLAAVLLSASQGWLLYYGDAEAHLDIARRLVDSQTPGYDQIGTGWLPL